MWSTTDGVVTGNITAEEWQDLLGSWSSFCTIQGELAVREGQNETQALE